MTKAFFLGDAIRLPRLTCFGGIFLVFVVISGCSCRRAPEFDSGLGGRRPSHRVDDHHGLGDPAPSQPGAAEGQGKGEGGAGGNNGGGGGDGSGSGYGNQADDSGGDQAGSDGAAAAPAGSVGSADGMPPAGTAGRGTNSVGQPLAGNESSTGSGDAHAADKPVAAFPGRPATKPKFSAEQAIPVAEAALGLAADSLRRSDLVTAYECALRAYEAVSPHTSRNDACRGLAGRASRMLKEIAERQNQKYKPQPIETIFE